MPQLFGRLRTVVLYTQLDDLKSSLDAVVALMVAPKSGLDAP